MKNKIRTRLLNNPITIEDEGIEQVFQLMRSKETVLWVGAGFCYGSSAPTVQSLKAILYDNYSTIINQNREDLKLVNLDELTQRIIYRDSFHEKNRNELLDGLKQYFVFTSAKHPLQTIVSQIPYIDQIITTNYDNLFELAYESRINVIYNNDSYTKNKNSENSNLFKIHGDFSDYSSIVLSKNDYANFIANNDRNLIIGKIKEILATKTVIFIGFSFEDMDINGILNWILEVIGKNTHYIIIPNAPTHKVEFLKSKGINYINMTAESFINDISKRTKLSLLCDIQSENISYTRAKRTTIKNGFIPELTTYNGKVFLNRITPTSEDSVKIGVQSVIITDTKTLCEFKKFLSGHYIDVNGFPISEFVFPNNARKVLCESVNGYVTGEIAKIDELSIECGPIHESYGMLLLASMPLPISVQYKLFVIGNFIKILIQHKYYEIMVVYRCDELEFGIGTNFHPNFVQDARTHQILEAYKHFSYFLNSTDTQLTASFFECPLPIVTKEIYNLDYFKRERDRISILVNYYQNLVLIEDYFSIQFSYTMLSNIPLQEIRNAQLIVNYIKRNCILECKGLITSELYKDISDIDLNSTISRFIVDDELVEHIDIEKFRFCFTNIKILPCAFEATDTILDGYKCYKYNAISGNFQYACSISCNRK